MNVEHKKQLLSLLEEYCDEDNYFEYGDIIQCFPSKCSFAKYDECPVHTITDKLKDEIAEDEIKNMDEESKKRVLKLLNEYCDDNHSVVIGQGRYCNNNCRFNCPVMYCINSHGTGCPVMDIRNQIKNEADKERDSK